MAKSKIYMTLKKDLNLEQIRYVLNTAPLENPNLISQIAKEFGSQSIVISIDVKLNGNYEIFYKFGKKSRV